MKKYLESYNFLFLAFAIVCAVSLLLRFVLSAHAYSKTVDQYNHGTSEYTSSSTIARGQTFVPSKQNIVSFKFTIQEWQATTSVQYYLCKGSPDWDSFQTSYGCSASGNELVVAGTTNFATNTEIVLPHTYVLQVGASYYFSIKPDKNLKMIVGVEVSGQKAFGTGFAYQNRSYYFDEYYDIDYTGEPDASPNVFILDLEGPLSLTEHDIIIQSPSLCSTKATSTCKIYFNYNSYVVDDTIFLYPYDVGTGQMSTSVLATTSVVYSPGAEWSITVPQSEATSTVSYYCIELRDNALSENNQLYCGVTVNWTSIDSMLMFFEKAKLTNYNINDACNGMDETASSTFSYQVECGLRRLNYWALKPSIDSQLAYYSTIQKVTKIFPLNVYHQIKDSLIAKTSIMGEDTASTSAWRVPLIMSGEDTGIDLLNDHMLQDRFGSTWVSINDYMTVAVYFFLFLGILSQLSINKTNK